LESAFPTTFAVALSDRTSALSGSASAVVASFRAPFAFTINAAQFTLETAPGTSNTVTADIRRNGTSILASTLSIANSALVAETSSTGFVGATSSVTISKDDLVTFLIPTAGGSAARGAQVWLLGFRSIVVPVPSAPTSVTSTLASSGITVSWVGPTNAPVTSYVVERAVNSGTPTFAQVGTPGSGATSFTDTSTLSVGTAYLYRVAAVNATGTSGYGTTGSPLTWTTVPALPTALSATAGDTQVTVSWTASANNGGVAGSPTYRVEGRTPAGSGTWQPSNITSTALTSAVVTQISDGVTLSTLANGTQYEFRAVAINARGETPSTSTATSTPAAAGGGMAAPTSFSIVGDLIDGFGTLQWTNSNPMTDISGFDVEWKRSSLSAWAAAEDASTGVGLFTNKIGATLISGATLTTASAVVQRVASMPSQPRDVDYDFRIRARNTAGSTSSAWVTITSINNIGS
jgi:hypothetical protein